MGLDGVDEFAKQDEHNGAKDAHQRPEQRQLAGAFEGGEVQTESGANASMRLPILENITSL